MVECSQSWRPKAHGGLPGRRSVAIGDTDTFLVLSRAFGNCSFSLLLLLLLHFLSLSYASQGA